MPLLVLFFASLLVSLLALILANLRYLSSKGGMALGSRESSIASRCSVLHIINAQIGSVN